MNPEIQGFLDALEKTKPHQLKMEGFEIVMTHTWVNTQQKSLLTVNGVVIHFTSKRQLRKILTEWACGNRRLETCQEHGILT